jgi:hypothetical protein
MFVSLSSIVIVVLALKGSGSRPPKGLPVVAAVDGTATGQSPSGETTRAPDDIAPFSKESLQSTRVVKEQSAEPKTQASLDSSPKVRAVRPFSFICAKRSSSDRARHGRRHGQPAILA